jgi:glutamine synthetase
LDQRPSHGRLIGAVSYAGRTDRRQGENVWNLSYDQRRERGMRLLPQNLLEAIEALEADEVVRSGLGPIADEYIKLKKGEWGEFMKHVTPWEVERYLTLL